FFLSRIDSAVDEQLEANGSAEALALRGRTAIANAKLAYQHFQRAFSGPRWQALAERGARPQRVLWASTSTKDPDYPDTMYVDELIGPHTVNTLPPSTLHAFLDHGRVAETVTAGLDEAERVLAQLPEQGVDLDAVCNQVLEEGIEKFDKPYRALMGAIGAKVSQLRAGAGFLDADLGSYEETAAEAAAGLEDNRILARIWRHDHTVWSQAPAEISNRLGWLHLPEKMDERLGRIAALADSLRSDGIRRAVLLGMGGSSLAPDVFSHVFGPVHDGLRLEVLDTTAPAAILAQVERLDAARTLFIVSTKSGTTVETLSAFKYFYNQVAQALGEGAAGGHFVAITDPGSQLVELAAEYDFRATLLNDPDLGGRYSALSYFGLAPAGLIGVDLERLLERAETMAHNNQSCNAPQAGDNAGQRLGAILGALAGAGRDKLTLVASDALANFGDWVEQLIAESTGKAGKGILPVVGEPLGAPAVYGQDRLFVHLRLADDDRYDRPLAALAGAGHPLLTLHLNDRYDLGGQFFLWEMATAVAGHLLGIQPFNQPNVEAAKERARELVAAYQKEGHLPAGESAEPSAGALAAFLKQARPGDYIA
ncbi:MAG: transaldolase family protein, partial [Candidatus Promineifilaceae bacterium]